VIFKIDIKLCKRLLVRILRYYDIEILHFSFYIRNWS